MSRVGVLISGRGTNLQALIDAQQTGELGGDICVVISNKSSAHGLIRAQKAGIDTEIVTKIDFPNRNEFDQRLLAILREYQVDLVVLAGFMRILTPQFIDAFHSRIINVHPSLLPAFKGVKAQWQAVEYGVRITGCTTHFVDHDVDSGPIILQRSVLVRPEDSGEDLAKRILREEHEILVESVRFYCEGRLKVEGRKVLIQE